MTDDKGKRRGTGPAEPQVPEEATLPVGAADAVLSASPVPLDAAVQAAAMPIAAQVQSVTDPNALLSGMLGGDGALGQFNDAMPSFGAVLLSIGTGVASSQQAMDESLRDTVDALQEAKITIVTDVIQELGDDGLPDQEKKPTLVTEEVSLVNYVPPTQQLWERVSLSMDLTVAGFSAEQGMILRQQQTQAQGATGTRFWGFGDWFSGSASHGAQERVTQSRTETQWSSGQVRLDALLGTRRMEKLPVGAEVVVGPQITFSQAAVVETRPVPQVTRRAVDVTVQVRRRDGAYDVARPLEITSDVFAYGFAGTHTSSTDTEGRTVVTVYRDTPAGTAVSPLRGTLSVKLGQIVRTLDITL